MSSPIFRRNVAFATVAISLPACVGAAGTLFFPLQAVKASPQQVEPPIRPVPHPPIRPLPPPVPGNAVSVKSVSVVATVREGVAETQVTHVLVNRTGTVQEADFLFPIPTGAQVSSFAMYDGETKMEARLLDKEEANATYEAIVRRRRDPALLTFQGRSALRARVFPIAPNSERKITLKLVSILPREGDAKKYAWTLVGPHLPGAARPEKVTVQVNVVGQQVGSVYSPTHLIQLKRTDAGVNVAWESSGSDTQLSENPELDLFIGAKDSKEVALSALAYNAALPQVASLTGGVRQSGYFLVVASPTIANAEKNALPRHVVMVMDRSGSMQGKKIEQAKDALRFALGKLRPQDTFNIITFSDNVEPFSPELVVASGENRKRAEAFIDGISADGGTNINGALLAGLKQFAEKSSGNTLLFFTDGLPTVGERGQDVIVRNAVQENGKKARTFVFGVGYDVDVPFLDNVSRALRGDADYVRPDENIEVKTSQFVAKTHAPVLENLKLTVDGAHTGEVFPKPGDLPDLFAGGQLVIVGRYTGGSDSVHVSLTGEANGKTERYELNTKFPAVETGADFLPRLWASRKIGYLMDEMRLRSDEDTKKETIDQIIALSKEYGILTPYTALFVPEPGEPPVTGGLTPLDSMTRSLGGFGGGGRGGVASGGAPADVNLYFRSDAKASRQGESAVNSSQASRAQRNQAVLGNTYSVQVQAGKEKEQNERLARRIQNVNNRAFYQTGTQGLWQDATFDAKKQQQVVKVKLFSPAYFALLRRNSDFAKWAAVGDNVRIVANAKQAVEFGPEGKETLTETELKALAGK